MRDALCESRRTSRSQKSVAAAEREAVDDDEADEPPAGKSAVAEAPAPDDDDGIDGRGKKCDGKLLASEMSTSSVCRQMMGAACWYPNRISFLVVYPSSRDNSRKPIEMAFMES